ncbi:hypothetical protein J7L87_02045 [bacterium]|nr:hypothetical protein [bacterium]
MFYFIIYDIVFFLFLLLFFPYIWERIKSERDFPFDWKERFSIYSKEKKGSFKKRDGKNIWLHTVSVGEFLSITPLLGKLKKEKFNITVSLTTKTGRKVAENKIPDINYIFFPFDFYPIMKKAINEIKPDLIVLVETEIWVNLLRIAKSKEIPVIIINGRISPRSFSNYRKFRFLTKRLLPLLSFISMRTEEEAEKIIYLGAEKEKVKVCGSIKFDLAFSLSKTINPEEVREKYSIPKNKRIIVFGSIHPEEEKRVVEIIERILKEFSDIICVIVPRFLDRTEIFKVLKQENIKYERKSLLEKGRDFSVLVVDTYGELNNFYSICEFAFVGGSLNRWGGQNPIEPTAFKKPVIYGKDNWHFFYEWKKIKDGGGGIEVENFGQLYHEILKLLRNPELAKKMGKKAYQVLLQNTGATETNFSIIKEIIKFDRN